MQNTQRLRCFIQDFTRLVDQVDNDEGHIFDQGKQLLVDLVSHDDWLDTQFAQPHPDRYQQYLLHCDPLERFSVASFIWGPGHTTPIHNHTVWGMVGIMRGGETCEEFSLDPVSGQLRNEGQHHLAVGEVDLVSPSVGDIHRVSNALDDQVSVSIHIYGCNIGAVSRHTYDEATGEPNTFISGYSNSVVPNLWDRSLEA